MGILSNFCVFDLSKITNLEIREAVMCLQPTVQTLRHNYLIILYICLLEQDNDKLFMRILYTRGTICFS